MSTQTIILLFAFGLAIFAAVTLVRILAALSKIISLASENQKSIRTIKSTLTNDGHSIFGNLQHVAKMTSKTVNHLQVIAMLNKVGKGVDDEDSL